MTLRDKYMQDIGDHRPFGVDPISALVPEMMYYMGARAVIAILKEGGPDALVAAVWRLEAEISGTVAKGMNEMRERITPADRLRMEMEMMGRGSMADKGNGAGAMTP